jgi:hypothetical protein
MTYLGGASNSGSIRLLSILFNYILMFEKSANLFTKTLQNSVLHKRHFGPHQRFVPNDSTSS